MNRIYRIVGRAFGFFLIACSACTSDAQLSPSSKEKSSYTGLLAAAAKGDAAQIKALTVRESENADVRDAYGRTPLHVATYGGHHEAMRVLAAAGREPERFGK
jgi:uncharacterized protein